MYFNNSEVSIENSPNTSLCSKSLSATDYCSVQNFEDGVRQIRSSPGANRSRSATSNSPETAESDGKITSRPNIFGKSITEKMYCFTGTAERIIKWHRIFKNRFCLFEVIASVVSMQEGSVKLQKIILLKDQKGPILQVVHYLTHCIQLEDFHIGQKLRCVGHMTGHNTFNAISIRSATPEEVATVQRHCYIGDYAISRLLNEDEKLLREDLLLH